MDNVTRIDGNTISVDRTRAVSFTYEQLEKNLGLAIKVRDRALEINQQEIDKWQALIDQAAKLGVAAAQAEPAEADPAITPGPVPAQ